MGQCRKFEFYALLNRKPMKMFKYTRCVCVSWESVNDVSHSLVSIGMSYLDYTSLVVIDARVEVSGVMSEQLLPVKSLENSSLSKTVLQNTGHASFDINISLVITLLCQLKNF